MTKTNYPFAIKVYKEYFNFAAAHFLIFKDGTREPLHGHNYRVKVKGEANILHHDLVFDFLDLKPIVRDACNKLDHKFIVPLKNELLTIKEDKDFSDLYILNKKILSAETKDLLKLEIHNSSAENLAVYLAHDIKNALNKKFNFQFLNLEVEVEETPGQSAIFNLNA